MVDKHSLKKGPARAMNRPLSTMRPLAVDPNYLTFGALVWIDKKVKSFMKRLVIANYRGAFIKAFQSVDLALRSGSAAGEKPLKQKTKGRYFFYFPLKKFMSLSSQ